MSEPIPTYRDQLTTLLLAELLTHLDAGAALTSYSHGVATALGHEVLATFDHLLAPFSDSAGRLRVYHQILAAPDGDTVRTAPAAGEPE
ncbi:MULTISPECIES: hypothetical protein [Nocardia]|uniref:hypothetical protein n=1 Tax=Nocardia TaxID=1817 RepID=UPI000D69DDFB|nr:MULTISPECIES: hypothetical protein [Nocardia]